MRIGAVIVAAGMSTRMKDFKQLMKIGELTIAERVVVNFQRAGIKDIVMVTGCRAKQVEKALQHFGITFLRNERYETTQMFDSAKIGLEYLNRRCDQIFFCPVDVPFFTEETLKKLSEQEGELVIPVCRGKAGHPIRIQANLIPSILMYSGEGGLEGAIDSLKLVPVRVEVEDEGAITDADTQDDFQHLVNLHNARLMRPRVKVQLVKCKPFFGPGTVTLLKQIDSIGSVREACMRMGISYSKGWKIIHSAEEELGYSIVERQPGGAGGGTAQVTEKGRKLLMTFELYEKQIETAADKIYKDIFFGSDLL